MLSEAQVRRVWEGMLGAEIRAKYFAELSGSYLKRQHYATLFTLLFASADAAAFFAQLPHNLAWIRGALAVVVAGLSIYLALAQNERKAIDSANLHGRFSRLQKGYEAIWEDTHDPDAVMNLKSLDDEAIEASNAATILSNDQKAMSRWEERTVTEYQARFAG